MLKHINTENKRLKHVYVRSHFIKEKIDYGNKVYIKSENELAEIFTKPLGRIEFEKISGSWGWCLYRTSVSTNMLIYVFKCTLLCFTSYISRNKK